MRHIPLAFVLLLSTGVLFGQGGYLLYQWDGVADDRQLGYSVSGAGDINGDGFNDLIIGALPAVTGSTLAGSALVYSGVDGSLLYEMTASSTYTGLGCSVSGAGDVNGDGFDDFVVGATEGALGNGHGAAHVYSGSDGALLYRWDGSSPDERFGSEVSGAGDVNGDGFDDIIVSAYTDAYDRGSAFVYSGVDGSQLYQWHGSNSRDWLGASVSGAGDVNGDGFSDLIVGVYGADSGGLKDVGAAHVYSGADGSLLYQWHGASEHLHFGTKVSGAGDVNGDGIDDLVVGAPNEDHGGINNCGAIYVYSGLDGSLLYQWFGVLSGLELGSAISGAGDVNGDGFDDVLAGSTAGLYGSLVSVYSGATGLIIYQWSDANPDNRMGHAVAGAGDVNGDGNDDIIFGAHHADPGGLTNAGSAYVYSGTPPPPSFDPTLTITNLIAGQSADIQVTDATASKLVYTAYSLTGGGPISSPWGDLALSNPFFSLRKGRADATGSIQWQAFVPSSATGKDVWVQAFDVASGKLSNGFAGTIQ